MEDAHFESYEDRRISLEDLQSMATAELESVLWSSPDPVPPNAGSNPPSVDNAWVTFEAEVRRANASAVSKIRQHGGERCVELLRLLELEEQTRCQAFQAALMGEVRPAVYIGTVRSIIEKLLGKLENFSAEPGLYQGAAQCLSEYLSSLNHHSDICSVPRSPGTAQPLPAIEEGRDYGELSSDYGDRYSERSEDTDTLSVHSEQMITSADQPAGGEGFFFAPGLATGGGGGVVSMSLEDIRKERRRESNKKAASKYRSKKTVTMQQVLAEQAQLRQQMAGLSSTNAVLSAENKLLKQQVAFLQGMLNPGANNPTAAVSSSSAAASPANLCNVGTSSGAFGGPAPSGVCPGLDASMSHGGEAQAPGDTPCAQAFPERGAGGFQFGGA